MKKRKAIERHYEPRVDPGREGYDASDWFSAESQFARFGVLADNVDLAGKRLLDVGCGLGDLLDYLGSRDIRVDYTGVDIVQKVVDEAVRRHPGGRFIRGDLFGGEVLGDEMFDVVFCSGAFNLDLGNIRAFLPKAVGIMLRRTRDWLVFNLLHVRAEEHYSHCVYCDPDDVRKMLSRLPMSITIVDDYLHNDFTVLDRVER